MAKSRVRKFRPEAVGLVAVGHCIIAAITAVDSEPSVLSHLSIDWGFTHYVCPLQCFHPLGFALRYLSASCSTDSVSKSMIWMEDESSTRLLMYSRSTGGIRSSALTLWLWKLMRRRDAPGDSASCTFTQISSQHTVPEAGVRELSNQQLCGFRSA